MPVIFSPASGTTEIVEYTGTTGTTVTASYAAETTTPPGGGAAPTVSGVVKITNVTYGDTVVSAPQDLNITFTPNGTTFTFSSTFDDMFYRVLKYLLYDEDNVTLQEPYNVKTYLQANRFKDLPELYTGLYEFVPSPINRRSIPFTISYTATITTTSELGGSSSTEESGTATWTFNVSEDFEVVIQKLLNAVNNGSRYTFAKTKYPELED